MKVSECMTRSVHLVGPSHTIRDASHMMAELDVGAIPVSDKDQLVGMITDRDIALRAVALGLGPDTKIREVMSPNVLYCFEDQDVEDVAQNMGDIQVRRLPVLNREKRLVGIISLGDLAKPETSDAASEAIMGVSKMGGAHNQSADGIE